MEPRDMMLAYMLLGTCARRYMFYPGKVENITFMVDATGLGFGSLGTMNKLKSQGEALELLFGCFMDKFIIINTSFWFGKLLSVVKAWAHPVTAAKINQIKSGKKRAAALSELIPLDQIESRYGGTKPNITQFWPPPLEQLSGVSEQNFDFNDSDSENYDFGDHQNESNFA